jgi:hypothetical protein
MFCEGLPDAVLDCVRERIAKEDFLTASELAFDHSRRNEIFPKLEKLLIKRYNPTDVHKALVGLAQRIYVTPNFDKILDTHFANEFSEGVSVKINIQDDLVSAVRSDSVLLIKSHGTIDDRKSIILTRSDYARARVHHSSFYRVLDSLFLTRTVLFVGCGTKDPDIELLLEDANLRYPDAPPHYMIKLRSPEEAAFDSVIEKTRNIVMLYYEDNHSQLPLLLSDLVSRVDARRSLI